VGEELRVPRQDLADIERAKQEVRERIWALLERENAVAYDTRGAIAHAVSWPSNGRTN
jgi:hypothetical protein